MRTLTSKQRKLLDQWIEQNKDTIMIGFQMDQCNAFTQELYDKIVKINDSEILYQEINRYISDAAVRAAVARRSW